MRSSFQAGGPVLSSVGKQTNFTDGAYIPGVPTLTVSDTASQLQCPPQHVEDEAKVKINPLEDFDFLFSQASTSAYTCRQSVLDEIGTTGNVHTIKTSIMKTQCGCGSLSEVRVTGFVVFSCTCDVEYITDINEYWSLKDILKHQLSGSITDYGVRMKCKHQVIRTRYIHRRGFCHCTTLSGSNGEETNSDDVAPVKIPAKEIKVAYGCQKGCGVPFHYHKVTKETKEGVTSAAKAFYEREKKRTGGKEEGAFYLCEYLTPDCKRVQDGQVHYHQPSKTKEVNDPITESLQKTTEKELGEADGIKEFKDMKEEGDREKPKTPILLPRVIALKKARDDKQKQRQPLLPAKATSDEVSPGPSVKLSLTTTSVDAKIEVPEIAEPKVVNTNTKIILDDKTRDALLELYSTGAHDAGDEKSDKKVENKRALCNNNNFVEGEPPKEEKDDKPLERKHCSPPKPPKPNNTKELCSEASYSSEESSSLSSSPLFPELDSDDNASVPKPTDEPLVTKDSHSLIVSVNEHLTTTKEIEINEFGLDLGSKDVKFKTPIFTNKDKKALRKTLYQSIGDWVRKKFYPTKSEYDGLFQNAIFEERLDINQVVNEYKGWFLRTFERDWTDPNYQFTPENLRTEQIDVESLLSMGYNGYYYGEVYHELAAWLLIKSALDATGPVASGEVYNYLVNTIANKMHTLPDNIRGFYFCPRNHATTQNTIMHVTNIKVAMCCKGALALPKRTNKGVPGLVYNAKDFL